jgi:8-oxo-dGTP pyrophosphatase MutT (NUDIX family)
VIDPQGRILLMQRTDDRKWAMPGGGLEVGETPAAGVVREAFEETGVRC